MKKTNLFLMFLACTLAIFSFIGCSSTPEVAPVEETPGETVVVDVPTSDELKAILEAVTQAKEAAKEAGADVAYPSEFLIIDFVFLLLPFKSFSHIHIGSEDIKQYEKISVP